MKRVIVLTEKEEQVQSTKIPAIAWMAACKKPGSECSKSVISGREDEVDNVVEKHRHEMNKDPLFLIPEDSAIDEEGFFQWWTPSDILELMDRIWEGESSEVDMWGRLRNEIESLSAGVREKNGDATE